VNSQSFVALVSTHLSRIIMSVAGGVEAFDVLGQEYRYNFIDVRPVGPTPIWSRPQTLSAAASN